MRRIGRERSRKLLGAIAVAAIGVTTGVVATTLAVGDDAGSGLVPISPCRLADTRPGTDRVGTVGTLSAAGTSTFKAEGDNGKCKDIPVEATAVSLNITALGATEQTFLTIWPSGDRPVAASLNPAPGQPPTPNAVTTLLSDTGTFNIYNNKGTVDVVIDVNGYYTQSDVADGDGFGLLYSRVSITPSTDGCPAGQARLVAASTGPGTFLPTETSCKSPDFTDPQSESYSFNLAPADGAPSLDTVYQAFPPASFGQLGAFPGSFNSEAGNKVVNANLGCTALPDLPGGAVFVCSYNINVFSLDGVPPLPTLSDADKQAAIAGITPLSIQVNKYLES